MIGTAKNVPEPQIHKAERRLIPARIETDQTRITVELESTYNTCGQHESQDGNPPQAEPFVTRMDRKPRSLGLDGIVEQHVQHRLIPIKVDIVRQPGAVYVFQSLIVGGKR